MMLPNQPSIRSAGASSWAHNAIEAVCICNATPQHKAIQIDQFKYALMDKPASIQVVSRKNRLLQNPFTVLFKKLSSHVSFFLIRKEKILYRT